MYTPKEWSSDPIAYFKSLKGRNVNTTVVQYHSLRDDGTIRTIDVTRGVIKTNRSFGSIPTHVETSCEAAFLRAEKAVLTR